MKEDTGSFNPLLFPIAFENPKFLSNVTSWHQHIPFAFVLVEMLKPHIFVELGTHKGDSYLAFCQAVELLKLETKCYAVDSWEGDVHSGKYDATVFQALKSLHDSIYGRFSTLIKCAFDDALSYFQDRSIDLLHIDGFHTYEAVKHDYECWLPKMSPKGIILFHDTFVKEHDFGVWKLWSEVREHFPSFEFKHGYGLGVLVVGQEADKELQPLLQSAEKSGDILSEFFRVLGERAAVLRVLSENGVEVIPPQKKFSQIDMVRQLIQHKDGLINQKDDSLNQVIAERQRQHEIIANKEREITDLRTTVVQTEQQVVQLQALFIQKEQQVVQLQALFIQKEQQAIQLEAMIVQLRSDIAQKDLEIGRLRKGLESFVSSFSWRLTAPLRWIYGQIKRAIGALCSRDCLTATKKGK